MVSHHIIATHTGILTPVRSTRPYSPTSLQTRRSPTTRLTTHLHLRQEA